MEIKIPFIIFEVHGEEYAIDAYFSKKLEKIERISTLIRRTDFPRAFPEGSLEPLLKEEELENFLKSLFYEVAKISGQTFDERLRHMRRWNLWRFLGVPTGFRRHLEEDEKLSSASREAMLSLSILQRVLGVKNAGKLGDVIIIPKGYAYYVIRVEGGEIRNEKGEIDRIYTSLLKIDEGFRKALKP